MGIQLLTDVEIIKIMSDMSKRESYWGEDERGLLEYSRMIESAVLAKAFPSYDYGVRPHG